MLVFLSCSPPLPPPMLSLIHSFIHSLSGYLLDIHHVPSTFWSSGFSSKCFKQDPCFVEFAFSGRPCVTLSACTILLKPYNNPVRQLILPPFYRLRNWEIKSLVQCHTAGSEVIRAEGIYSMGPELFCWPPGNNEWVANELHMSVTFVWVAVWHVGGRTFTPWQLWTWRPATCSHGILWANLEAFGFRNRLARLVPFDDVGEKSPPQLIFLWILGFSYGYFTCVIFS